MRAACVQLLLMFLVLGLKFRPQEHSSQEEWRDMKYGRMRENWNLQEKCGTHKGEVELASVSHCLHNLQLQQCRWRAKGAGSFDMELNMELTFGRGAKQVEGQDLVGALSPAAFPCQQGERQIWNNVCELQGCLLSINMDASLLHVLIFFLFF